MARVEALPEAARIPRFSIVGIEFLKLENVEFLAQLLETRRWKLIGFCPASIGIGGAGVSGSFAPSHGSHSQELSILAEAQRIAVVPICGDSDLVFACFCSMLLPVQFGDMKYGNVQLVGSTFRAFSFVVGG